MPPGLVPAYSRQRRSRLITSPSAARHHAISQIRNAATSSRPYRVRPAPGSARSPPARRRLRPAYLHSRAAAYCAFRLRGCAAFQDADYQGPRQRDFTMMPARCTDDDMRVFST